MNMNLRSAFAAQASAMAFNVATLSDDDAEMMSLDAQSALQDLEQAHSSLARLQDTATATADTVFIASQITEASNVDLALIDNAINHLGAGEGITGDHVMPNMQNYAGSTVNMQSLRDMASSVWQAIKDLIKRIRDRIVKFFKSRWGDSAKLRKRLKSLINRCEKMSGKTIDESKTELGREIKYVTVAGDIKKNGNEVTALVGKYNALAAALYETWIKNVTAFGGELEAAMGKLDVTADESSSDLFQLLNKSGELKLTAVSGANKIFDAVASGDERSPEGVTRKRCDLAGNQSLFAADEFHPATGASNHEQAKLFAKARVSVEPYSHKPKELEEKGEVATWSVDTVSTLCNDLISVLDIIDRYDDSKYMKDSDKQADKVVKAGDKLAAARQKQDEINATIDADAVAYQGYASAYASWSSQGLASFASNFNSFANGVTVIAAKCLSNHK